MVHQRWRLVVVVVLVLSTWFVARVPPAQAALAPLCRVTISPPTRLGPATYAQINLWCLDRHAIPAVWITLTDPQGRQQSETQYCFDTNICTYRVWVSYTRRGTWRAEGGGGVLTYQNEEFRWGPVRSSRTW